VVNKIYENQVILIHIMDWLLYFIKKKMKTSNKISIKFTIFVAIILFIFGIFLQIFYFQIRYSQIKNRFDIEKRNQTIWQNQNFLYKNSFFLWNVMNNSWFEYWKTDTIQTNNHSQIRPRQKNQWQFNLPNRIIIENQETIEYISSNYFWKNFYIQDNSWFFAKKILPNMMILLPIDDFVSWQKILGQISIIFIIFFTLISFLISKIFVQNALYKLFELVQFVKSLNSDNLYENFEINWNPEDEINILAKSINYATNQIYNQTKSLKDFISFVSHELRTPIMMISSDVDYIEKSKKYENLYEIKENTKKMEKIIEKLLELSRIWSFKREPKDTNISNILDKIIINYEKIYKNKKIKISKNINQISIKTDPTAIEIIFGNLISNAFKYCDLWWSIDIFLDKNIFSISNTWIIISEEEKLKIWDKFWKKDESRNDLDSFGIGLSLVREVCNSIWYNINIETDTRGNQNKNVFIVNFEKLNN